MGNYRRQSQQGRLELGCLASVDRERRTIWIVDAHRDDGQRFVVRGEEILAAFLELACAISLRGLSTQIERVYSPQFSAAALLTCGSSIGTSRGIAPRCLRR